ncbi:MAG: hypothetical protein LUD68_10725, partial [Rikenellaceae bacterium]|nr:hypothetical protein [Rikenellaceae bacterium]
MSFSGRGNRPAENHAEESAEEAEPAGSFFDGVDPRTAQLADSLMDHGQFVLLADSVAGSGSPASEALTPVYRLDLSPADSLSLETPALDSL